MKAAEYWLVIFKHRRLLIRNTLAVTFAAVVISLILTEKYTATATILPPSQDQTMMLGMFSTGMPSSIANLSRLTSGLPGLFSPSDLFAALMKSSRIKSTIIRKYNLKKEFKTKTMIDASKALDEITDIEVTPEGIIAVDVTYKNKQLAVDIANSYIEELDKLNKEVTMTTGKKYRIFVEERLKESQDSLAEAEKALKDFQEKNLTISLEEEMVSVIQTIAELKSRIILLEVRKGAIAAYSHVNNPYLIEIDSELKQLKSQLAEIEFGTGEIKKKEFGAGFAVPLAQLPNVYLEYLRLFREVKIQEAIFELLTQQYEQAKIMEQKDTPTVQFLDIASPPEKRSFPRRTFIVVFAFALSIVFNILLAFTIDYVNDVKNNPKSHKVFVSTFTYIADDIRKIKEIVNRWQKRSQ